MEALKVPACLPEATEGECNHCRWACPTIYSGGDHLI
jgi:hypothetical protein